jgi:electron transfer flavoprotein beta subunit
VKIVVCVKQVPATTAEKRYTSELRLDRAATEAVINPLDEYAIEQALRLKEGGIVDEVVYLSMGPDSASEALRRSLAMGGDGGVLVTHPALAGADEWVTARVLAAALDRLAPEVTLMGMASDDARGSLVPGAVAAIRGVPLLAYGANPPTEPDRFRPAGGPVAGRGQRDRPGGGAALCQPEGDHGRSSHGAHDLGSGGSWAGSG